MSDKKSDNDNGGDLDGLRIKKVPVFQSAKEKKVKGAEAAPAALGKESAAESTAYHAANRANATVIEFPTPASKAWKVLRGGKDAKLEVLSEAVEQSAAASVQFGAAGLSASVSASTRHEKVEVTKAAATTNEAILKALKATGGVGKDGKPLTLEEIAKIVSDELGLDAADEAARKEMAQSVAKQLGAGLRVERGGSQLNASIGSGQGGGGGAPGAGTVGGELVAGAAALVGGMASLAGGAIGALGRGIGGLGADNSPAARFKNAIVLPTISEYRVRKLEETTADYGASLEQFWALPKLQMLRAEIEERARVTGMSVPDAMAKMKPGGELAELHNKFVAEVAASPEAVKAKVALDGALKSYIKQHERSWEELRSADVDENPKHRDAKTRVEATQDKMAALTALSPVFGGEKESHAQRFGEAMEAVMARMRELTAMVIDKLRGGVSHDAS